MSYKDYQATASSVGRTGSIDVNGLQVRVKVIEEKFAYGRIDAKVVPLQGSGEKWVHLARVSLD